MKIRFYGFMGGRDRKNNIAACKEILKTETEIIEKEKFIEEENICPCCGKGKMIKQALIHLDKPLPVSIPYKEYSYNFA